MSNKRIWDVLGKTDPAATKGFQRAGGFKGTAVKPMWCNLRMTEMFGPCGLGWGMTEPKFDVHAAGEEMMVFCTVGLWYMEKPDSAVRGLVYGVGGDSFLKKQKSGLNVTDEAFKMAYTDALGNAMKFIGVAADIHMGLFDDNKYVKEMIEEFSPKPTPDEKAAQEAMAKFITRAQADALRADLKHRKEEGAMFTKDDVTRLLLTFKVSSFGEITTDVYQDIKDALEGL